MGGLESFEVAYSDDKLSWILSIIHCSRTLMTRKRSELYVDCEESKSRQLSTYGEYRNGSAPLKQMDALLSKVST